VQITPTIRLFELEPDGGAAAYPLGGHLDVGVLIGGKPDTRSYSLIGPPTPGRYRIAVKLHPDSRGGSAYMWSLAEGARLRISSPRTDFQIDFGRPDTLLIAGGIGITPIAGMALALARHGGPVRMLYAARKRDELAFADELRAALGDRLATFVSADGERIDLAAALAGVAPPGWRRCAGRCRCSTRRAGCGAGSAARPPTCATRPSGRAAATRRNRSGCACCSTTARSWCRRRSRCSTRWKRPASG
jgi:vanillate O-demethylase ferredoxin subunit